ncbi:MAG: hypothetical protein ACFE9L_19235 [Candidatus Hodarchaeota archaeon]
MGLYLSRGLNQQQWSQFIYYVAIAVGAWISVIALYLLFPDYVRVILSSASMVVGVSFSLLAFYQSSREFSFFVPIILGILSLGLALIFPDASALILLVGLLFIAFSLLYYNSRSSARAPVFFVSITLGILAMSVVLGRLAFVGLPNFYLGSFLCLSIVGLLILILVK